MGCRIRLINASSSRFRSLPLKFFSCADADTVGFIHDRVHDHSHSSASHDLGDSVLTPSGGQNETYNDITITQDANESIEKDGKP